MTKMLCVYVLTCTIATLIHMSICILSGASIVPVPASLREGLTSMTATLWWHAYGGLAQDMSKDVDGNLSPAHALIVLGESSTHPDDLPATIPGNSFYDELSHLRSFDHEPSEEERQDITPEEYRDNEQEY